MTIAYFDPRSGANLLLETVLANPSAYGYWEPRTGRTLALSVVMTNPGGFAYYDPASGRVIPASTVLGVGPTLGVLSLSTSTATQNDPSTLITIIGATFGSTLSVGTGTLPTGLTLNSASRTISGTATTIATSGFSLVETLVGATNSPRSTAGLSISVVASGMTLRTVAISRNASTGVLSRTNDADQPVGTTYQWFYYGTDAPIAGQTGTTLNLRALSRRMAYCVPSNNTAFKSKPYFDDYVAPLLSEDYTNASDGNFQTAYPAWDTSGAYLRGGFVAINLLGYIALLDQARYPRLEILQPSLSEDEYEGTTLRFQTDRGNVGQQLISGGAGFSFNGSSYNWPHYSQYPTDSVAFQVKPFSLKLYLQAFQNSIPVFSDNGYRGMEVSPGPGDDITIYKAGGIDPGFPIKFAQKIKVTDTSLSVVQIAPPHIVAPTPTVPGYVSVQGNIATGGGVTSVDKFFYLSDTGEILTASPYTSAVSGGVIPTVQHPLPDGATGRPIGVAVFKTGDPTVIATEPMGLFPGFPVFRTGLVQMGVNMGGSAAVMMQDLADMAYWQPLVPSGHDGGLYFTNEGFPTGEMYLDANGVFFRLWDFAKFGLMQIGPYTIAFTGFSTVTDFVPEVFQVYGGNSATLNGDGTITLYITDPATASTAYIKLNKQSGSAINPAGMKATIYKNGVDKNQVWNDPSVWTYGGPGFARAKDATTLLRNGLGQLDGHKWIRPMDYFFVNAIGYKVTGYPYTMVGGRPSAYNIRKLARACGQANQSLWIADQPKYNDLNEDLFALGNAQRIKLETGFTGDIMVEIGNERGNFDSVYGLTQEQRRGMALNWKFGGSEVICNNLDSGNYRSDDPTKNTGPNGTLYLSVINWYESNVTRRIVQPGEQFYTPRFSGSKALIKVVSATPVASGTTIPSSDTINFSDGKFQILWIDDGGNSAGNALENLWCVVRTHRSTQIMKTGIIPGRPDLSDPSAALGNRVYSYLGTFGAVPVAFFTPGLIEAYKTYGATVDYFGRSYYAGVDGSRDYQSKVYSGDYSGAVTDVCLNMRDSLVVTLNSIKDFQYNLPLLCAAGGMPLSAIPKFGAYEGGPNRQENTGSDAHRQMLDQWEIDYLQPSATFRTLQKDIHVQCSALGVHFLISYGAIEPVNVSVGGKQWNYFGNEEYAGQNFDMAIAAGFDGIRDFIAERVS